MAIISRQPDNLSFLSPTGFTFICDNIPNVEYFCQTANLPGVSVDDVRISTPLNPIYTSSMGVTYEELRLDFIVDEDMRNWNEIYRWIISLGAPQSLDQYSKENSSSHAVLSILTGSMNPNVEIHFYNLFPTSLSGLEFDTRNTDITYFNANVAFRYNYYEFKILHNR